MVELAARLAALDLRQAEASVLILVAENPGVTASALGRRLDIRAANMVPLLKRLDEAGLIHRAPIDGKSQGLALTPAGQAKLARARDTIETYEGELLARIPRQHREHLLPALHAIWRQEPEA